jgi:hypothetical protein
VTTDDRLLTTDDELLATDDGLLATVSRLIEHRQYRCLPADVP